jgi:hypothetical protein
MRSVSVPLDVGPGAPAADAALTAVDHATAPPQASPAEVARAERHRQRLAWAILWLSSAIFLGFIAAVFLGAGWYRDIALSPRSATLEIHGGTVLYQSEESVRETTASDRMRLQDGDRVRTASDGRALISLPDGSNIQLWPDSQIQIRQLRSSTFTDGRAILLLSLLGGHARAEVAVPTTQERRFEIQTPQARALLREGSYRIELSPNGTELSVRTGSASVTAREQTVEAIRGERTIVAPNARPTLPVPAVRNLIRNGDFTRGFEGWQQGSRNEEDRIPSQVNLSQEDGRFIVRLRRQGSNQHGEAFLQQSINRDVTDENVLRVAMDVKVVNQTLSGGGWRGSEYPLLVRLRYRDAYGNENTVVRGLYVKNPDGLPVTNGVQVQAGQWLPLTLDLFDEKTASPRPAHLLWLEVESSGWDYEAFVTGIQVLAE